MCTYVALKCKINYPSHLQLSAQMVSTNKAFDPSVAVLGLYIHNNNNNNNNALHIKLNASFLPMIVAHFNQQLNVRKGCKQSRNAQE